MSVSFTKKDKDPTGGLTPEGRKKYKRETGGNLEPPVTKKTGLSPRQKARRKSFCARMEGNKGPKKKDGKLTRKGLALRRWQCGSVKTEKRKS